MWEIATIFRHFVLSTMRKFAKFTRPHLPHLSHQILEFYYSEKDLSGNITFKKKFQK